MSKVTGESRRIASCHNHGAPMTHLVIEQRSPHRSSTSAPSRCAVVHPPVAASIAVHRTEHRSTMIAALGFFAAALSISVTWPQVWRSCRHGRTLGLSPTASWLGVALNLCWLTFGLLIGDPAQILTNSFVGMGNAAVLVALLIAQPHLRTRPMLLRTATGAVGLVALAAGSYASVAVLGAEPAAVAAMLSSVIFLVGAAAALPQPLSLMRDRTKDVSGLSATRWRLGAGSCASWVSYGWLIDQPMVWLSGGFGLCCALVMCVILQTRGTAQPVGAPTHVRPAVVMATRRLPRALGRSAEARAVLAAA
jgi:uncharacterized protein with PQ loop repeat